jgi:acyl phosphate:glycerol-3-phosphate acyltransferase
MMSTSLLFVVLAYGLGSVPFGKLISGYVAQIDITRRGSGNIGATNVARELGMKWGVVTLILDILKGFGPMLAYSLIVSGSGAGRDIALAAIGLCALLGHMFPVFLKFRGGKGVATALGVYLAISPMSCLCGLILFVVIVAIWDFISLGSMIAACSMPVFFVLFGEPGVFVAASAVMAVLVCYKHKDNVRRLVRREEAKWKERKRQPNSSISLSNSSSE